MWPLSQKEAGGNWSERERQEINNSQKQFLLEYFLLGLLI